MSDRVQGTVADTGESIQRQINQATDAADQLTEYIRERPLTAIFIAVGIGYILGKLV